VFGDVNAGAQVVADGNIVVLGALRGVAHAGARGDESASVVAFQLQSSQVRIASHIALPPEREGRPESAGSALRTLLQRDRVPERSFFPEIAQLQGGAIVFGPFRGRLSSAGRS
jgi:septum site-determining protein MinC